MMMSKTTCNRQYQLQLLVILTSNNLISDYPNEISRSHACLIIRILCNMRQETNTCAAMSCFVLHNEVDAVKLLLRQLLSPAKHEQTEGLQASATGYFTNQSQSE